MIETRINNIKRLLSRFNDCEITIFDKRCAQFFQSFFDSPRFYRHSCFDECNITLGLYLPTTAITPTLFIEYIYEYDREGYDTELVLFNDDSANYRFGDWGKRGTSRDNIEYSDIPEEIWEIIEDYIKCEINCSCSFVNYVLKQSDI